MKLLLGAVWGYLAGGWAVGGLRSGYWVGVVVTRIGLRCWPIKKHADRWRKMFLWDGLLIRAEGQAVTNVSAVSRCTDFQVKLQDFAIFFNLQKRVLWEIVFFLVVLHFVIQQMSCSFFFLDILAAECRVSLGHFTVFYSVLSRWNK